MRPYITLDPARESPLFQQMVFVRSVGIRQLLVRWRDKERGDAVQFLLGDGGCVIFQVSPFGFDFLREFLGAQRLHQNLDPGFINVVATAVTVVHPQHGFAIAQQMLPWQVFADHRTDNRGPAHPAAGQYPRHHFALRILRQEDADIVDQHGGTVFLRTAHGNLEFARQPGKFRMKGRPLPQNFAIGTRIDHFVRCHTGKLVGGDIADAIARSLDRMHFNRRQLGENVRRLFQLDPVVLNIGAGREMAIVTVMFARDLSQHAQLAAAEVAVGNRHAQHIGMTLVIQTVLQTQRLEFLFRQFVRQPAPHLVTELHHSLVDNRLVILVVLVHTKTSQVRETDSVSLPNSVMHLGQPPQFG